MIYLSAQPDDLYFLWQLKLQIYNFEKLGIQPEQIHVLIGYDPVVGLNPKFENFIRTNRRARFFPYPDQRISKKYLSSIRPHIIWQHFNEYPFLQEEIIFYHDSDIIFRELPLWEDLLEDDIWYTSDTSSYTGKKYLIDTIGEDKFRTMCEIVGVNPELTYLENDVAGGAQYLMKRVTSDFWQKTEQHCENLYSYLKVYSPHESFITVKDGKGIQAWCADMWVVWWNALLFGHKIKTHPSLDFCWANSPLEEWYNTYILHYTGSVEKGNKNYFRKGNYCFYEPFDEDLSLLDRNSCSYPLSQMIRKYRKEVGNYKIDMTDFTFLLTVTSNSLSVKKNLFILLKYLIKYLNSNYIVVETGTQQSIKKEELPSHISYYYDKEKILPAEEYLGNIIKDISTKYAISYNVNIIAPIDQLEKSRNKLLEDKCSMVVPYGGSVGKVDVLTQNLFERILDPELLLQNIGKTILKSDEPSDQVLFYKKENVMGKESETRKKVDPEIQRIPGVVFQFS